MQMSGGENCHLVGDTEEVPGVALGVRVAQVDITGDTEERQGHVVAVLHWA